MRNWHEGRELMSNDVLVLLIVVVLALIFALVNGVRLLMERRHSATAVGTIQTLELIYWAKWATVRYKVGTHTYVSENRVHVPGYAQIGDEVTIRYNIDDPTQLYHASARRVIFAFLIAVACAVVAWVAA